MPKIKVHSGAAKRFKKTGSGLKRKQANKRHILTKMSTKSKRQLRGTTSLADGDPKLVKRMFRERSEWLELKEELNLAGNIKKF